MMQTKRMPRRAEALFLFFLFISFFGWSYEVFLEVVVYRWGFSNRGVLTGPYCPVYGVGAVLLLLCLRPLLRRRPAIGPVPLTPVLAFLGIVVIATGLELAASYLMEWTSGGWMWDYTRFHPNFQGRIALNPSLRFGAGGMVVLYLLYPAFQKLLAKCSDRTVAWVTGVLGGIFLLDCVHFVLSR